MSLRLVALLVALLACGRLLVLTARSESVLDSDEAVHAVEGLRLYDSLLHEGAVDFLEKLYFPERWHPPVQDHLRWYPPVHSLLLLPSFALLGRSDFAARVPSIVMLLASALLFYALARRLAPRAPELAGLLAVLLLLSSPNILTFSAQCLIEPASLAVLSLALLLYLRSLEREHPLGRALWAGMGLTLAFLTKYDHGVLLGLALGLAELVRARGNPRALARPVAFIFLVPVLAGGLWLAHPDKLAAFLDAVAHPFYGSPRLVALSFGTTWFLEQTSGIALALVVLVAPLWAALRGRSAGARTTALFALLGALLLVSRARFFFRYSYGVAPFWLLLAGAFLPEMLAAGGARLACMSAPARRVLGLCVLALGLALALALPPLLAEPVAVERALGGGLERLLALRADRFGLSLEPAAYAAALATGLARACLFVCPSLVAGGLVLTLLGAALALGRLRWRRRSEPAAAAEPRTRLALPPGLALGLALLLASAHGVANLWARLPHLLAWEYEGAPALHGLSELVDRNAPPRARILLGGGWDQYANNTLRWELACRRPAARYDELEVTGDMIGSLVLPEEPRIAWWTNELANAPFERLPELLVLLDARESFLYRTLRGSEVDLYREVIARRGGWRPLERRDFPELGLEAEVWKRVESRPPLEPPLALAPQDIPPGRPVGLGGWLIKDDSWRALRAPWVQREAGR